MEEWIEMMAKGGALVIEGLAAILIVMASLRAGYRSVLLGWVRGMHSRAGDPVRLELGRNLALALEFLVGADVLRTAVAPTWDEIGMLAAIVGIRSVLNYFLEKERSSLEQEMSAA